MITMHPGEYLSQFYLEPFDISQTKMAEHLQVSKSALSRLLSGDSDLSPEMAVRLSYVLDRSAESWMEMQSQHSLKRAKATLSKDAFVSIFAPEPTAVSEEILEAAHG